MLRQGARRSRVGHIHTRADPPSSPASTAPDTPKVDGAPAPTG